MNKKRIYRKSTILSVIIVAIVLTAAFLIYSLYTHYEYLSKIIHTSYNGALSAAISKYRTYRFDKMFLEDIVSLKVSDLDLTSKENNLKNITMSVGDSILMEISDFGVQEEDIRITIDDVMYGVNSVLISASPFELHKLDSIYSTVLKDRGIESEYDIIVYKHNSDSISEQSRTIGNLSDYQFHTARKESDSGHDVQVYFKNLTMLILGKMSFFFVFSFVMFIIIFTAITYQSHVIARRKKIERIRQDFTDSMTHELRHPLQGALSMSEILGKEEIIENDSLRNDMLARLKANLQNIAKLIDSMTVQAYSENLQTVADLQQGNLKKRIEEIIANCLLENNKKIIRFDVDCSDEIKNCRFDPMHFPNAVKNLVENAVKYSNEEVNIDIRAAIENGTTEITVADNGIGITEEDLPHIFDKFYKGNSSIKNHGFGLGLSYVKWVCDIHDGQVSVSSTVGKGSVFKLIIPNFTANGQQKNTDCRE